MRRLDWIVAGGFVALGLLCLLAASGVWMGGPMGMGGGMMVSMRVTAVLVVAVLLLAALALLAVLPRVLTKGGVPGPHCGHCGRRLQPAWLACPYCGERVRGRDGP